MFKSLSFFFISLLFLFNQFTFAASQLSNSDSTFDQNIVTVLLHPVGEPLKEPIIELNKGDQLELSFDDLSNQYLPYQFTFVHCSSDWKTSPLKPMDYIEGYFEGNITQYEFSFNTLTPYIHYTLIFPTAEMRPKLSGNYLLKVYLNKGGEKEVIITRRFFVVEQDVVINAKVSLRPKDLNNINKKQQIDLSCETPNTFSAEPEQRFKVTIRQNDRWDNVKMDLHPSAVDTRHLYFNYPNGIVFNGGNEPRFFDMKSFHYLAQNIKRIIEKENYYQVFLHTDFPRAGLPFETYRNINGKELITARSDQNPATEGDYALVEFRLKMPEFKNAGIYILGALTDWQYNAQNKMKYNPSLQQYEGQLLLKQGYYEYWYAVVPTGKTTGDIVPIEGNHWETNNTYTIYVYYHNFMPEYDRLVGIKKINSH